MTPSSTHRFFNGPGNLLDHLEALLLAVIEQGNQRDSFGLRSEIIAESARNPAIRELLVAMDARMARGLARLVEQAQSRGEITPSADPHEVAALLLRLLDGLYMAAGCELVGGTTPLPLIRRLLEDGLPHDLEHDDPSIRR